MNTADILTDKMNNRLTIMINTDTVNKLTANINSNDLLTMVNTDTVSKTNSEHGQQ